MNAHSVGTIAGECLTTHRLGEDGVVVGDVGGGVGIGGVSGGCSGGVGVVAVVDADAVEGAAVAADASTASVGATTVQQ